MCDLDTWTACCKDFNYGPVSTFGKKWPRNTKCKVMNDTAASADSPCIAAVCPHHSCADLEFLLLQFETKEVEEVEIKTLDKPLTPLNFKVQAKELLKKPEQEVNVTTVVVTELVLHKYDPPNSIWAQEDDSSSLCICSVKAPEDDYQEFTDDEEDRGTLLDDDIVTATIADALPDERRRRDGDRRP